MQITAFCGLSAWNFVITQESSSAQNSFSNCLKEQRPESFQIYPMNA